MQSRVFLGVRPTSKLFLSYSLVAFVLLSGVVHAQSVTLFSEDFESLTLGQIVTFDTELRETEAWTDTPPAGWIVDDSGVPTVGNPLAGVTEFEGWSFVDRSWWTATAGDQDRGQFVGGQGIIAVADPDEWDDFPPSGVPDPESFGTYNAKLTTPSISIGGAPQGLDIGIFFNSSWRPEDFQKASLTAVYDDPSNTRVELLRYESEEIILDTSTPDPTDTIPNPFYKPDATNEIVNISLIDDTANGGSDFSIPANASSFQLEFLVFDAGNDWWWAFDNLQVFAGNAPSASGELRVEINRDTNVVRVINDSGNDVDLRGYSITSNAGVFDEQNANFLAPTNGWLTATNVGDAPNDLSEINLTSDTLADGQEINLGPVWSKFFQEAGSDVNFEYLIAGNDTPLPGQVSFVGNGDAAFEQYDLNFDGTIDILDWNQFKSGFGKSLNGLTEALRYQLSDLDNDGLHTVNDFLAFQTGFEAANGAGSFALALSGTIPEPTSFALVGIAGVCGLYVRRRGAKFVALLIAVAFLGSANTASAQLNLYFEDFDGSNAPITLGPFQEEGVDPLVGPDPTQQVITQTLPGWTNDNSGVPGIGVADIPGIGTPDDDPTTTSDSDGIVDWSSWAWVDKQAWVDAAGDQDRSQFIRASGNVMVADPDEWDDADSTLRDQIAQPSTPDDLYDVFATSPVINIPAGIPAGRIQLSFDSSWRSEAFDDLDNDNNQTGRVFVSYDGGPNISVFRRESDPEASSFVGDATNERLTLDLQYDGVASTLQLEFGLVDAWNDWWWAIDNIAVEVPSNPLKLRINTFNGEAFLEGDDQIVSAINFLSVNSANGVLTGDIASGLSEAGIAAQDGPDPGTAAGDFAGEQWENLTDSETADSLFAEAFLFGETAFDDTTSFSLGHLFDIDTLVADRDVSFTYSLGSGTTIDVPASSVEYFTDASAGLPGDFNSDGNVDAIDFTTWRNNLGTLYTQTDYDVWAYYYGLSSTPPSASVPEPSTTVMVALAAVGLGLFSRSRRNAGAVMAVALVSVAASSADAAVRLDRNYKFGDDSREGGAVSSFVGSAATGGISIDSEGLENSNQIISVLPKGPSAFTLPRYVDVSDRPDIAAGLVTITDENNVPVATPLGIALNPFPDGTTFNEQYLHTGFEEALNFPQYSPSSTFSQGGTINYDLISDRGFQLWVKPTAVQGEQHIVMDTNQHGVLINDSGEFAMRYAFNQDTIDAAAAEVGGNPADFADLFDTPSGVTAQNNTWYHLSVVRPFGPNNGSIFYIDGVAVGAATGRYNVEVVVNDDQTGLPILDDLDTSPLVIGASTGNPTFGDDHYFRGVVDDLEMFVMGLNSSEVFPDYVFEEDNGYAKVYKPALEADVDGDGSVNLTDATTFANNWLSENRLTVNDNGDFLLVGDLNSRLKGDLDYNGIVDLADWAILNNANPGVAIAAARAISGLTIPEPSTLVTTLCLLAVPALLRKR